MNVIKSTIFPSEMSWSGSKLALIGNTVFKYSTWVDILCAAVTLSQPSSPFFPTFLFLTSFFLWPFPSFLHFPPLHFTPLFHPFSLSLSSHSCTSFSLPLSSPEGMSKCMVEWRREVGLALPNSISEKLELREACLPSESKRWPAFTVS